MVQKLLKADIEISVVEFCFQRKDGKYMWRLVNSQIVEHDKNGKPLRFVWINTDIADFKLTYETFRLKETALSRIF